MSSRTSSPAYYPQPIPVASGVAIAHPPGEPFKVLLVRCIDDDREQSDKLVLPSSVFTRGHASPIDAARRKLKAKTGCEFIGDPRPILADLRKGRDFGRFCGYHTDHCLDIVVAGPVRGKPSPSKEAWTRTAEFYDITELDPSDIGRGHDLVLDWWMNSVVRRDRRFSFLRHTDGNDLILPPGNFPRIESKRLALQVRYPGPIPIMTSTWIAHRYNNPFEVLFVEKNNDPLKLKYLAGGIFDWHNHRDLLETGPQELDEEAGLKTVGEPFPLFFDFRRGRDMRQWCNQPTDHCLDLIVSAPVRGKIKPKDRKEVRRARFIDVRKMDAAEIGYGHARTVDKWIEAISSGEPLQFSFILS